MSPGRRTACALVYAVDHAGAIARNATLARGGAAARKHLESKRTCGTDDGAGDGQGDAMHGRLTAPAS